MTATSLSFLEVFGLPTLFELSCQLISRVQPGPMTCVSCLIGLRYVELLSSVSFLLFFLLLFPCDARYPSQLLKEVSVIGSHWSVCDPVVFAHLQCGIDPRTSGRLLQYSVIRLRDGQETTVSTSELAIFPKCPVNTDEIAWPCLDSPTSEQCWAFLARMSWCILNCRRGVCTIATCILRHWARTRPRFRMKMCKNSVGLRGHENALIGLVIGLHNFEGGRV